MARTRWTGRSSYRNELLSEHVLAGLREPIRESPVLEASLKALVGSVKAQKLEGLVAKRRDSRYEPGNRSGAWQKMRVNQGQEFVVAGYTPRAKILGALVFGYYDAGKLLYADGARNGFTPASREQLFQRLRGLEVAERPFANRPESKNGRWGDGLMAGKMKECRWLAPAPVGPFEFVEWTPDGHLRHSRFMELRDGKKPAKWFARIDVSASRSTPGSSLHRRSTS